jgi:hypothetical protein
MKTLITLIIAFFTMMMHAQVPQKMSYQAVIRDASDNLVTNQSVGIQISILQTSATGTVVFVETHTEMTNINGLVSLEIGTGSLISGDFTTIPWGNDLFFIKIETDPTGGTNYTIVGTSQLLSVPYALYAGKTTNGNTLDQAYNQEQTTNPSSRTIAVDDGKIVMQATGNSALEIIGDPAFIGLQVFGAGSSGAIWAKNTGVAAAVAVEQTGTGDGIYVFQTGAGDAIFVDSEVNSKDGIEINFLGTEEALDINHVSGTAAIDIVTSTLGNSIVALIENPLNVGNVFQASTVGEGTVVNLTTENNNLNSAPTLEAVNRGSGSVANFITFDELVGKVNVSPTVNIISNGKGAGLNVNIINVEGAGDANTEPAIFALHEGEGQIAHFENTFVAENHAVEIINKGAGNGLHIDNFDHGSGTDNALHVEQSNLSFIPSKGYAALFELHEASGLVDSTVKITSAATSLSHSALRVHASSIANLAATFEGDVHISSDLTIGTSLMVPTATFTSLTTNGSGTIGALTATSAIIQDLVVTGSIVAPAKAFKIDHPLDEENKFLFHNSIESNERLNVYSGNVNTDNDGFATVTLPDYMSALNADFRYQLTILDKTFAQAIIWEEFNDITNTFTIKTNQPNIKVSWQLTGARIDKWAKNHPLQVEVLKEKIK